MPAQRIPFALITIGLVVVALGLLGSRPDGVYASHVGSVSAGGQHTCVVTWAGGVKCWGRQHFGQLGDGVVADSSSGPVDVIGLTSGIAQVSAGAVHTCAATTAGGVKCWGAGGDGELGNGTRSAIPQPTPVDVVGLTTAASVSAGSRHTCAVTTGGGAKCWGDDTYGELGAGQIQECRVPGPVPGTFEIYPCSLTPVDVQGLTSGVDVVAAGGDFSCALMEETTPGAGGGVKCWGSNARGRLGDGQACGQSCASPVNVGGLTSGVAAITVGENFACAQTLAGGVKCWGDNSAGQLGDGQACSTNFCATPVDVAVLGFKTTQVLSLATNSSSGVHTCAITAGGVWCWGLNFFGEVDGTPSLENRTTPVSALVGSGMAAVSAGGYHTCAMSSGGSVRCWGGDDYGQSASLDGDSDGCADAREFGPDPRLGGQRDSLNPWDYFNPTEDGVNRTDDISAVVRRYRHDEGLYADYDTRYDRTSLVGGNPWQFGPPDGKIRIFEVTAAVRSYGHDCA